MGLLLSSPAESGCVSSQHRGATVYAQNIANQEVPMSVCVQSFYWDSITWALSTVHVTDPTLQSGKRLSS